jgi:hypothetical protein
LAKVGEGRFSELMSSQRKDKRDAGGKRKSAWNEVGKGVSKGHAKTSER